ncbi:MAG: tRNA lysidine(34) synthetase TilS [Coriobacteriia bacterium]|nr:tRNA lysidine(34) synthetase TilS [Coriobacteriia bacterium]MCL2750529.1 tRNA lysidine(34) synthetase TilS [Coriobacteriia bacterium]
MTVQKLTSLLDKVEESLAILGLDAFQSPRVLMVSGGCDSVALLLLMHELCLKAQGSTEGLLVLHLNHQLRGEESLADELFVAKLCEQLGVACRTERRDVAAYAKEAGLGIEQAGRALRYELAEAARTSLAQGFILTAHTADDRAETLLQRLIVGGGSSSLASIPKRNGYVVRPLLDCTKQELQSFVTQKNLPINGCLWREDATNRDTQQSRAFVRHELLPLLAERNPRIIESLNRTAEILTSESIWLDEQALKLLPLTQDSFSAPLPLLRRAIYLACNKAIQELAPQARITFEQVELIARQGSTPGFACQIPGGIEVRNTGGQLSFVKAKPPKHDPRA